MVQKITGTSKLLLRLLAGVIIIYLLIWACNSVVFGQTAKKSATASWDANTEPDLKGYKIYYGTAPRTYSAATTFDIGNQTSVQVNDLEVGKTYYFAVTAYDQAGNESEFSDEVSLFIAPDVDTVPPGKVRNFTVFIDAQNGTITVNVGDTTNVKK